MDAAATPLAPQVRAIYGASLAPDATAVAHLVDDGGYPRAVQRFLRGWRASSWRDVDLPVVGPVLPAPQGGPAAAPSLAEAIGSPVVPEAPTAKRSSGGGMFDTLSGNVLTR